MKNPTVKLFDYHKWANSRVLNHLKELPGKVYSQEVKSVFSSISEVIVHIYQVDAMWLSVMSGNSFEKTMEVIKQIKEKSSGQNMEGMESLYKEVNQNYESFFDGVGDLDKVIQIEHPRYGKLETPVSDLVRHVVNHGTYHRGNITAMLRQQEHAGVPTDYIYYLYEIANE